MPDEPTRYPHPITLRPEELDLTIIQAIKNQLQAATHKVASNSDAIRFALREWWTTKEDE